MDRETVVGLIDWDKCATVPLAGYDPVAFAREGDEEMCLALFSAEETEDGGGGEVGRWYRSRVGKLGRALESSGQSYRVWVAKEIFEELYDGSWETSDELKRDCMRKALELAASTRVTEIILDQV